MNKKRYITYCEALREAIEQEMERDSTVFIYGVGVTDHKRIFGSTDGLLEQFGKNRCFDTPISEDSLAGFALGSAINGLRPIFVNIRMDFMLLAFNQIANMISSFRYNSGGRIKVPLVIRVIVGRGWGQGSQHSKSMHSIFAHLPGIKVVIPTTPRDAKGMLISAIRDDNPVIFIEHRWLYWQKGEVPEKQFTISLDQPNILKKGNDITIVSLSWMNVEALKAAEILKKEREIEVEIIDPRSANIYSIKMIEKSVKKTGYCIIADNDWLPCGVSSEIAFRIYEKCMEYLKLPIERIGFAFTPCPTARHLENEFYPNAIDIIRKVEKMLNLSKIDLSNEEFYSHENKFTGPF